jgi:hypothetical protein
MAGSVCEIVSKINRRIYRSCLSRKEHDIIRVTLFSDRRHIIVDRYIAARYNIRA